VANARWARREGFKREGEGPKTHTLNKKKKISITFISKGRRRIEKKIISWRDGIKPPGIHHLTKWVLRPSKGRLQSIIFAGKERKGGFGAAEQKLKPLKAKEKDKCDVLPIPDQQANREGDQMTS